MSALRCPARRAFVARALASVLAGAWLPRALAAEASLGKSDWRAIRNVIRRQLAALLVARYTEFLDGALVDGVVIQPLRLVAPDNTVLVAFYSLQKLPDGWRINGCRLAPSTVQAA
jgi:hypothetical protein